MPNIEGLKEEGRKTRDLAAELDELKKQIAEHLRFGGHKTKKIIRETSDTVFDRISDEKKELSEEEELVAKSLTLTSAGSQIADFFTIPFTIVDAKDEKKEPHRILGQGMAINGTKGKTNEQINFVFSAAKAIPIEEAKPANKVDWQKVNEGRIRLIHSPQYQGFVSGPSFFSKMTFFLGEATPMAKGTGFIQNGSDGNGILTDSNAKFKSNDFYLGYLLILSNNTILETKRIISNTENTITIDGSWETASGNYEYRTIMPIFLGSADTPWARLYVGEDIRFGYGNSGGSQVGYIKWGKGSPEGVVTANIGSIFLRQDGGASTTLYVKESDNGLPTGWVAK